MGEKGKWGDPFDLLNVAVHASLLPTGKVLYWGRRTKPRDRGTMDEQSTNTYIWDPSSIMDKAHNWGSRLIASKPKLANGTDVNLFCSGHTLQPDGTLLVVGGHLTDGVGVNQACVYTPKAESWTARPLMTAGRWYPSALTLPDGRVLAIAGCGATAADKWVHVNMPQIWDKDAWVQVSEGDLALYPRLHLTPNGRVFAAGPLARSYFLDVSADGISQKGDKIAGSIGAWEAGPDRSFKQREYAPSVMYEPGKVMFIGGGNDPGGNTEKNVPTNAVEYINLNESDPKWKTSKETDMKSRRQQHNATLLPDGTVLVTGGTKGTGFNNLNEPVHESELWDPKTSKWTVMDKEIFDRCYHSIALLLPDGQVLSAGGGEFDPARPDEVNLMNAQLFKPPYLFKEGTRPTVSNAPSEVKYGEKNKFTVKVGANDSIGPKASWMRLGSVTHACNFSQSLMFLDCSQNGSTVTVTPPANAIEAPAGHYMLFLWNKAGLAGLPCVSAPIIGIGPPLPVTKKAAVTPAHRTTMAQRVTLSNSEHNEKIITEQARPAVAVGLTPLCYYGLGPCWGGAYEALQRMSDIEVVRPVPSQVDSVAFVYLKQDILPDIDVWRREFANTANGAYVMRGIEMTLSGVVTRKQVGAGDEQLTLAGTTTRPEVVLEPFQASNQIRWDKDAKAQKPITDVEADAYKHLSAALADHAAGATVQVTGWLQKHDANKFSLHVRKFEMK